MTDHYNHGSLCYKEEKINKQQAPKQGTFSSPAWEALQTEGLSPQGLRPSLAPMNEQGPLLVCAGITNNALMARKPHKI